MPMDAMRITRGLLLLSLYLSAAAGLSAQQNVNKPMVSPVPVAPPVAALPAAAGQASPAPAPVSASYVIGADDALLITVWKDTTLSGPYTVRPDGIISMPLLGDVVAAGQTPGALSKFIAERLTKYIVDPLVTVSVQSVNSKRIYMVGEVGHVGPMALVAGLTPLQAIASAGGPTTFANVKHIYILRNITGKEQKIPFNYKKAVKDGDSQGITLMPGDTIVIP